MPIHTNSAAGAMREQYSFDENSTVVMDFACGVGMCNPLYIYHPYNIHTSILGLISRELAPYAKTIVGVDITQALVDNYNQRVANQGISPDEMRAVCTELKGKEGELDGLKFDVIVVSLLIIRDFFMSTVCPFSVPHPIITSSLSKI